MSIELLERAAETEARILKAEQLVEQGSEPSPEEGVGYLLTFDVGRILVLPDSQNACLALREIKNAEDLEAIQLLSLAEEEPWWRVLGQRATRAWLGSQAEGALSSDSTPDQVRLQFRPDTDNPKVISMEYADGRVQVRERSSV
ncbi:MAG: hypothetical protein ACJZ7Z_06765 [Myxococcota bacterium]|nr:hypothetical protein [Spirochaeta sp.]RPG06102.1 MAG: hypothetical protein CBC32_012185 [Proteobacteria bacterium TMED72]